MPTYANYFTPDLFFVTAVTLRREPVLGTSMTQHLLRSVLTQVKQACPFQVWGYVGLPEHLHLLVKPGANVVVDQIMDSVRLHFTRGYQELMGMPTPTPLWETDYVRAKLQDVADFAAHLDYIHYDPVQHGYVKKPGAWPYSSFQTWVERGLYDPNWGETMPERVQGKRWG